MGKALGGLFGGGASQGTQTSTSEPWKPAQGVLEKLLKEAGSLYDKNGGINAEYIDKEIADLNPEMQGAIKDLIGSQGMKDMIGGMNSNVQTGVSGIGQATGALGNLASGSGGITSDKINNLAKDLYQSDVVKSQKDQLTKDVQQGLKGQIQGLNQQATSSGNMGSSRAGVAEGVATGKAADAIASGSAAIQNSAMQNAMGQAIGTLQGNQSTQLGAANQLGSLGLGSGQLGLGVNSSQNQIYQNALQGSGILQNQQQNVLNNNWMNSLGQQSAGWDNIGKLLGVAGPVGGMGGSSNQTGNTGAQSGFNNILGMGSLAMGAYQQFSDASLKKKVKKKGKTSKGNTKYDWEWNDSAKKRVGKKGKDSGVLAQEVAKTNPDAISKDSKTGRLMVDYDKV